MIERINILLFILGIITSSASLAEPVYLTDQLQFGLHSDKDLNSPIVKIVSSGTILELIKTEDQLSFVREPGGTDGWIDNSYISKDITANALLRSAEARIKVLEESTVQIERGPINADANTANLSHDEVELLKQELQQEKQRTNQLQIEATNQQQQVNQAGNTDSLYEKIEQLSFANQEMEQQLASIISSSPQSTVGAFSDNNSISKWINTKNVITSVLILLVTGIVSGMYLMDYVIRRRHGGFRV
jgi:SH3 domain protein